jgi:hypothetical protein
MNLCVVLLLNSNVNLHRKCKKKCIKMVELIVFMTYTK